MNSRDTRTMGGAGLLASLVLVATVVAGCCDKNGRVSMDEFMQMNTAIMATTAPAPKAVLPPEKLNEALGPYRVAPGDVIAVTVTNVEGVSQPPLKVRVDRNGQIRLPMVGLLTVKDKPLVEVEKIIYDGYVPQYQRDITVYAEVSTPETVKVLVTGAVTNPGLVPLRANERNLLSALVVAGGISEGSSGFVALRRLRDSSEPIFANLVSPEGIQEALALAPLEDGDVIEVMAASPNVYFVGGLVYSSAPQYYAPGVRVGVLQALAAAGGLRMDIFPREATLTRRMQDGKDVRVKLDLNRLAKGEDPNIDLMPGDILWVPHTWDTRFEEWFVQNIYFRGGVTANAAGIYTLEGSDLHGDAKDQDGTTIIAP